MTSTPLATASQSGSEGGGSPLPAAPAGARQRPPRPPAAAAAAPQATCVRVRGGRSVSGRMGLAALGRRSAGLERRQRRQCRRRQALCARQGNCTCFSPITSYYTQPTHSPPRAARCARPPQQPPPLPSLGAPGAQLAPGRCPAACCTLPSCARGSAAAPVIVWASRGSVSQEWGEPAACCTLPACARGSVAAPVRAARKGDLA